LLGSQPEAKLSTPIVPVSLYLMKPYALLSASLGHITLTLLHFEVRIRNKMVDPTWHPFGSLTNKF